MHFIGVSINKLFNTCIHHCFLGYFCHNKQLFHHESCMRRKENPQKLTQLSTRSHPRQLVGKRTTQKDITIDTTSDSQVNSNFPNRWSPASLTFNNYFYLFLYLYITWIATNNDAPHLKSPKNQSRRAALGRPAIKITGGLELVCGRPTLALSSALFCLALSSTVYSRFL